MVGARQYELRVSRSEFSRIVHQVHLTQGLRMPCDVVDEQEEYLRLRRIFDELAPAIQTALNAIAPELSLENTVEITLVVVTPSSILDEIPRLKAVAGEGAPGTRSPGANPNAVL